MTDKIPYTGLVWTRPDPAASQIAANSALTPMTYLIDYTQTDAVTAHVIFAGGAKPVLGDARQAQTRLGTFRDVELALVACERHDFAFARSRAEAEGQSCVFVGSERVAATARHLRTPEEEIDSEQILDMLVPDYICKNGVPFRRMASYFEAKKTASKQNSDGSFVLTFTAPPRDIPIWLLESPLGTMVTLGAVQIAGDTETEADRWAERGAHAFTRAHMLPNDPLFQEWLGRRYDRWALIANALESGTSDDVAKATLETLKRLIGVPRRRDLHTNRDAIEKIERLDREYYRDLSLANERYASAA